MKQTNKLEKIKEKNLTDYIEMIITIKKRTSNSLLSLGALLLKIKNEGIYEEQFETFEEFLGSPEVSFSRATAYKIMAVVNFLCNYKIEFESVEDIDTDKLYRIIRVANTEQVSEWIEKARTLSRSDLANEVRELRGLPQLDPCKRIIEYIKEFLYEWCPEKNIKPDELEIEDLIETYEKWKKDII